MKHLFNFLSNLIWPVFWVAAAIYLGVQLADVIPIMEVAAKNCKW